ncbi:MAG: hypothetical protein HUU01_02065 [Saprospiraceae bacterium]|nr:hypothetical protein [Saprospiraceae bacterium]
MRHRYLFFAITWCIPLVSGAQRSDSLVTAPRLMLKASIAELAGAQYSKIHFSAALRLSPRQYIEIGGGKLMPFAIAAQRVGWNSFSGYTVEAGYKLYNSPLPRPGFKPVWWWSGGVAYQELQGNIDGDFSRQDQSYTQRLSYGLKDQRVGGKLSGGILFFAGKHITIDWGLGLFIFDRKWAFSELPQDVLFLKNGSRHWHYSPQPNHKTEARVSMILKLGWVFY